MQVETLVIMLPDDAEGMVSGYPSALHKAAGIAVIDRVIAAAGAGAGHIVIVSEAECEALRGHLGEDADFVACRDAHGFTAMFDLVRKRLGDGLTLIVQGNMPLVQPKTYARLAEAAAGGASKLVRSDDGAYCALCAGGAELKALDVTAAPSDDTLSGFVTASGLSCMPVLLNEPEYMAVYDRASLWQCDYILNSANVVRCLAGGVTIPIPSSVRIEDGVSVGRDSLIGPNVQLTGATTIGEGTVINTGCLINDTKIGANCTLTYVVANSAEVDDGVTIGPFVNLRPGTHLLHGVKVGDFVEIKNSTVGEGTKVPHLTYMGDADVGAHVNVGCGTVFVNYDGKYKHRTTVGNNVFLGCQTNLVAPVKVGDGAFTAAGSTITKDVPGGAMAFARSRQINMESYAEAYYRRLEQLKPDKDGK